jgi:rod shape-determining protein MreC
MVVLAVFLLVQLLLLAYQLRQKRDIPLIREGTALVVTPVHKALQKVSGAVGGVWYGYVDLRGARRESNALQRELNDLKLENHRLRTDADQGRRLQVLLNLREQTPRQSVAARVISSGSSETAHLLTIDKGRNAGIEPDLPVLVPDGVVGKVLHVFPDSSQVLLLTDLYSGVAALLEESRVHGILKGRNEPLLSLGYVPEGEPAKVGQRVLTSGEDRIYPKGLPAGIVVEVTPGEDFQQITVQPSARLNRVEEVLVLLKEPPVVSSTPLATAEPAKANPQSPSPAEVPEVPAPRRERPQASVSSTPPRPAETRPAPQQVQLPVEQPPAATAPANPPDNEQGELPPPLPEPPATAPPSTPAAEDSLPPSSP